jgi:hypothetical protein
MATGIWCCIPGSGAETYKMAYNATSTIAALQTITKRLLELPANYLTAEQRAKWQPLPNVSRLLLTGEMNGHKMLSPAQGLGAC